jgi:hypothetical protein
VRRSAPRAGRAERSVVGRFRPPVPPRPEQWRKPAESFGWLDARLLHEGWLARLGAEGAAVLVLLALAADARGASFYSRARMAERLGLPRDDVDHGLRRLLALELVAFRPWEPGSTDGVWQILPLPAAVATTAAPTRLH